MALTASFRAFFETIRVGASQAAWSQGAIIARSAAINLIDSGDDEIIVRVRMPTDLVAKTVKLFPEDDDWLCDCKTKEAVCEHTAGAVIAYKAAAESGTELPRMGGDVTGRLVYRLVRSNGGLKLVRLVESTKGAVPLAGSIAQAAMAAIGVKVSPEPVDYEIETALGIRSPEWIPPGQMVALLRPLGRLESLTLDGKPVRTDSRPVGLTVRVTDHRDGGFVLTTGKDNAVTESFNNGVALCGDRLHPVGETGLTARELEDWKSGRIYRGVELSELVTSILPNLERRARVEILTQKLPKKTRERPRIVIDVETLGHELVVLPTLVYGSPPIARVDGTRLHLLGDLLPLRDEQEERRLLRRLEGQLGLAPGQKHVVKGEAAVAYAARLRRFDTDAEVDGDLDSFFIVPGSIPRVEIGAGGAFDVRFEVPALEGGKTRNADPRAVLAAFRDGANLVPLLGGGWSPLPMDWLRKNGAMVQDLLAAREANGTLPNAVLPDLARLCQALDVPPPPSFERLRSLVGDFQSLPSATLPPGLDGVLRDYQHRGVDWLTFLAGAGLGALLADDMGLGKTLQALCALRGRTLVVAPTSVVFNWRAEIARFRPGLTVNLYAGPKRALDRADITITSYALLRIDADILAAESWDTAILDEAQAIKNPDSQAARAAFRLKAGFRMALTGTPVENRLEELWSQFNFTNRGLLGGWADFQERYGRPISAGEPGVAARLRDRIRPFVLRRKKADVAPELPPRTEVVLRCELTASERAVYDAIRMATQEDVVERLRSGGNVLEALEALLRLRQASSHSGLVPGQEADGSSKVDLLLEHLEEAVSEGHKALVFSQWTSLLDKVEPHLEKAGLAFGRVDGSTRDREEVVRRFQADDGPPVLLLSLKAGGTGLNLTAADHVFLLDPWWNPAVEDQAADRAHRIGQDKPVFIHRLVATDTVEERILVLQAHKRSLADAALDGSDRAAGLTRDDLASLLA